MLRGVGTVLSQEGKEEGRGPHSGIHKGIDNVERVRFTDSMAAAERKGTNSSSINPRSPVASRLLHLQRRTRGMW